MDSAAFYRKLLLTIFIILPNIFVYAQAKLIINGGAIQLKNGAALIIDNPDNTAITSIAGGYIQSEEETNRVIWIIGSGGGNTYTIPFGNPANLLTLSFTAVNGAGIIGQIICSTYPTPTWKNSDFLPAGVTNVNSNGNDNSAKIIDRFWQINPQGYSTKPDLSNVIFTYSDDEYNAPNTLTEANLFAQRWNSTLQKWNDFFSASTINTTANTIQIANVPGSQLYDWWTMTDITSPLPVTLVYFNALLNNKQVNTYWQTATEQNSNRFEVWRSKDAIQFILVGARPAAGFSSSIKNYSYTDVTPFTGTSYYRLKSIDNDGSFSFSPIVKIKTADAENIFIYPNPATDYAIIKSSSALINKKPIAKLYDAKGGLIKTFLLTDAEQKINTLLLPAGSYHIGIGYNNNLLKTLFFIKK